MHLVYYMQGRLLFFSSLRERRGRRPRRSLTLIGNEQQLLNKWLLFYLQLFHESTLKNINL
jgi:hypothetical protein